MRKKIEPLPCLCGSTMKIFEHQTMDGYWLGCINSKCFVNPVTATRKTRHGAVSSWNRWITNGVKRLSKIIPGR